MRNSRAKVPEVVGQSRGREDLSMCLANPRHISTCVKPSAVIPGLLAAVCTFGHRDVPQTRLHLISESKETRSDVQ